MFNRIVIFENQVALILKDGNYRHTLTAGQHWLKWGDSIRLYQRTADFTAPVELNILLADTDFANEVEVIKLEDHELALHFQNGNFRGVLKPGQHVFWKSVVGRKFERIDTRDAASAQLLDRKMLQKAVLIPYLATYQVESYEKALLLVDGKLEQHLEPGQYHFWNDGRVRQVLKADMRTQQLEVAGQEMLTRDKAALRINFNVQYRIVNVVKALLDVRTYSNQLHLRVQLALREYVGMLTLDELLARKQEVNDFVLNATKDAATEMGLQLDACGIRDIILPGEMKDIMNQVLIAEKQAQANTILRREETASTRSLLNTAKLMEDNAMLQRLKEMEYVEKIAEKINTISVSGGGHLVEQLREIFVK